ncbi:YihY/virulence factor BrkB family protein [Paraburkholderia rhizosphaerae]|uniref:Membrane protein n=1 Tax=Paraburkholderia rhizosphaerae TaxID=480658 RepID=A0A4R8LJC5_9BURK|nr:YihY/virulence factor BrkB family protein [Paraburkholderia rhizosphaerae]TDY43882.1 membrane protein [Paraburkholderia rhizosphaerae]
MTVPAINHSRRGRWHAALRVARDSFEHFLSDRCPMMAASVGFYSAFSLAPTLLIVLAIVGWFVGEEVGQGRFFAQVQQIMGADAAGAMRTLVEHAHRSKGGGIAAALSLVLLVVGASAIFSSLNTALDVVFHAKPGRGIAGLALLVRTRLVSLALVLGIGFLLVVSLVLDAALEALGKSVFGNAAATAIALAAQSVFGLIVLTLGLSALIKWLPDVRVAVRHALAGGFIAAIFFTIGRHLFGLYLAHAGTAGSFGAAGSLAVLMMWLYFCAAVFLFGAEVSAAMRGPAERKPVPGDAQRQAG